MKTFTENELRARPTCIACGKAKDFALVVCWHCFKRREDITPLKYWIEDCGSIESWQAHLAQHNSFHPAAPETFFSAPESVEDQKARLAAEAIAARRRETANRIVEKLTAKLTARPVDTTRDLFGGTNLFDR